MRKIIQIISTNIFIRILVKTIIMVQVFFSRIWSNLYFKSMVKNSGNSICHYSTEIKYGNNITIGNNTRIGPKCTIGGKGGVFIGDNVVVSKNVTIETAGLDLTNSPPYNIHKAKKIIIKDGVWLASNVIVLSGVTIGENAVIGAGVVITKDIPKNAIIVGQPFRRLIVKKK